MVYTRSSVCVCYDRGGGTRGVLAKTMIHRNWRGVADDSRTAPLWSSNVRRPPRRAPQSVVAQGTCTQYTGSEMAKRQGHGECKAIKYLDTYE